VIGTVRCFESEEEPTDISLHVPDFVASSTESSPASFVFVASLTEIVEVVDEEV
jgi:hypothetical protein